MAIVSKRKTAGDYIFYGINYTFFSLFTIMCIFPFYYIFINTISDNQLVSRGKIVFFPVGIHFINYIEMFRLQGIGQAAMISVSRTVLATALAVISCSFIAYLVCQREMWGRRFWYRFIVVTMYFSPGFIPGFLNYRNLGLINNYLVYIIPGIIGAFNVILLKTYIESIPASLQESAVIDGAGYLAIYSKIILPLSIPVLATIAIFTAVGNWNQYTDTLFYITDPKLYTLQFILWQYYNELNALAFLISQSRDFSEINASYAITPIAIRMTVTMFVTLPILIVYPLGQKYFMKGIMLGAMKG